MLDDQLSPVRQNLGELRERPRQEIRFRLIVARERMCAFDDPVDLIIDMLEEARAAAFLKTLEYRSDVVFGNHKPLHYVREDRLASHSLLGSPRQGRPHL